MVWEDGRDIEDSGTSSSDPDDFTGVRTGRATDFYLIYPQSASHTMPKFTHFYENNI